MFLLLTRILLWLLIGTIFYYILVRFIPRIYLTRLGGLLLFIFVVLAFINPNQSRLVSQVWSILSFPLKPLGLSIVLFMSSLRDGVKKISGKENLVVAGVLVLLLSSVPILAYNLAQQVEREGLQVGLQGGRIVQVTPTPVVGQRVGAIVVLGPGNTQANLPLSDTGIRLTDAAQLYQEQSATGNQPLVIVTNTIQTNDITALLGSKGVPANQIVVEPRGVDLRSTAERVNDTLRSRGIGDRRIILVAPALTSRRAVRTFGNLGLTVIPRSVDSYTVLYGALGRLEVENFIPNVQALTITTRVVEEFLTSIYYFLRGWQTPS